MRKYLYLIKKQKIKSWLKFWLLTKDQVKYILSEILEGFSFDLQNTVKRYFKIFNIFGNSIQDGTPTPTNPVPIESVADDVNLFDETFRQGNQNSTYVSGRIFSLPSDWLIKNGDVFIFSTNLDTSIYSYAFYIAEKPFMSSNNNFYYNSGYQTTKTFVVNSLYNGYFGFTIRKNDETNINPNDIKQFNFKIQKGTEVTPYSPYNYGTFTIDFEGQTENYNYTFITEPLRSLPNGVRDSLEADGIHRRVGRVVLDGTETWNIASDYGFNTNYTEASGYIAFITNLLHSLSLNTTTTTNCLSDYNPAMPWTSLQGKAQTGLTIIRYASPTNITKLWFAIPRSIATTVNELKTWLSTHNVKIYDELTEEIIEPYTEEQQEQYNKIKELYTFDGTTNISSTDVVPPYLQIQYYMKGE